MGDPEEITNQELFKSVYIEKGLRWAKRILPTDVFWRK